MRRFQLLCPHCGHIWQERSRRNLIDWLREQPANLVGGFIWVVPVVCLIGFVAAVLYSFFKDVDEFRNVIALAPILGVLFALSLSIILIARR